MVGIPEEVGITRMPISTIISVFISYLIIHIIIAVMLKKRTEELGNLNKESKEYTDLAVTVKWLGIAYKWFPAVAVVMILIGFYL